MRQDEEIRRLIKTTSSPGAGTRVDGIVPVR
jgi:hypothetical protein